MKQSFGGLKNKNIKIDWLKLDPKPPLRSDLLGKTYRYRPYNTLPPAVSLVYQITEEESGRRSNPGAWICWFLQLKIENSL